MTRFLNFLEDDAKSWGVWTFIVAAVLFNTAYRQGNPLMYALATSFGIGAIGLWFQWKPARGLTALLYLLYGAIFAYALSIRGFSLDLFVLVLACGFAVWAVWKIQYKKDSSTDGSDDDVLQFSLALLLKEPKYLEAGILAKMAEQAWDTPMETANEDDGDEGEESKSFVVGESPIFIVQAEGMILIVHNHDEPYFESPEKVAEEVVELRVRHVIAEHRAWVSVDCLSAASHTEGDVPPRLIYQRIGRLLAEMLDEDCLAILIPREMKILPYEPTFQEILCGDDPLQGLLECAYVPVVQIEADDPDMQAAVAEARRRWPEFVAAFENRESDDQTFSVKVPISDGDNTEFIWVMVTAIENDVIYGKLGNEPVNLHGLKLDDRVRSTVEVLSDWIYSTDEQLIGGFSLEVFKKKIPKQDQAADES